MLEKINGLQSQVEEKEKDSKAQAMFKAAFLTKFSALEAHVKEKEQHNTHLTAQQQALADKVKSLETQIKTKEESHAQALDEMNGKHSAKDENEKTLLHKINGL